MNSLGLLDPSYLLMCPALNCSSQTTYLSDGGASARKSPLPDGVTSLAREHCGGVGDLTLRRLRSSMILRRSSLSRPHYRRWRFQVIRRHTSLLARRRLPLADDAVSLWALFARSFDRLSTNGSPPRLSADHCAMTKFAASTPC
jgi:hypothetical protein